MKKNTRFTARVLALVMALLMVFSYSATVFAAEIEITTTDYYELTYNSDAELPEIVLTLDAQKLGTLLANRNFTKEELLKFLPDVFANALKNGALPSIQELFDFFPAEMFSYDELSKLIPAEIMSEIFTAEFIEKILPREEWASVLPLEEMIDKETIETLLNDYPEIMDSLLTPAVMETLLTPEVLDTLLTPAVMEALLTPAVLDALLTPEVLEEILTPAVLETLLTPAVLEEILTPELIEELVPTSALESLLTPESAEKLLTPAVLDVLLTPAAIEALLTPAILDEILTPAVLDALLTPALIDELLTPDVIDTLVTPDVVKSMIADKTIVDALVNANIITEDALINLLSDTEKLEVAGAADPKAAALEIVLANYQNELVTILMSDADAVVNTIGASTFADMIGTDKIVDTIGLTTVAEEIGYANIADAIGAATFIETIGITAIVDEIGFQNIVNEIGIETIINEIGISNIVGVVNVQDVIAKVDLNEIVEIVTIDKIVETIGTDKIVDTIGIDTIVETIGTDKIVETIGIDTIIDTIGTAKLMNTIGVNKIVDEVLSKCKPEFINSLINKALNSPSFDLAKIFDKVNMGALKNELVNLVIRTLVSRVEEISLVSATNGTSVSEAIFKADVYDATWYFNNAISLMLDSVPTVEKLQTITDGEVLYDLALSVKFFGSTETAGLHFVFKTEGDTTLVNTYAAKLLSVIEYYVTDGNKVDVTVDDSDANAPITFAELFNKVIETGKFDDAKKAELFSIFEKSGAELVSALKTLDLSLITNELPAGAEEYVEKIRNATVEVLEKAMEADPSYAALTLASIYDETKHTFTLPVSVSVSTDKIINKLCGALGVSSQEFTNNFSYDTTIDAALELVVKMNDVYRVRYFDDNGAVLYTTFLPVDADLALINDNTAVLSGKAPEGWKDANGTVITTMPAADLDLYPTVTPVKNTYFATFVADGKVVAKLQFTEGDKFLVGVPAVPFKEGYFAKWEAYTLGNKDITIKAIYTAKTYTVRFDANGGEGVMGVQIFAYDDMDYLTANNFTREGYAFAGWNTKADGTGYTYTDKALVRNLTNLNGIVLYAQWTKLAANEHIATFVADGQVLATIIFKEGDTTLSGVPSVPAKAGYTGAWSEYTLGTTDITVTAKYTANSYIVSFDANGGEGTMVAQSMTYGTTAKLNSNLFTRDGYEFIGWNTKANGTGTSYADAADALNLAESGTVVLYAQWKSTETETTTDTTTTTTPDSTTTAPVVDDESGFPWVAVIISTVAVVAVGGVVAFLIAKKKKV
ncbi:MAG: InlB B-repeat-containing protein [Clostridia bacterium]|nr:InlB B-repeat-containing protein [Clostridia bacterium]